MRPDSQRKTGCHRQSKREQTRNEASRINATQRPPTFKGRTLGITLLTTLQLIIGSIHVFFGLLFLSIPRIEPFFESTAFNVERIYGFYTASFGVLTLVFTFALWMRKNWGLLGTIGVSTFVVVADSLTLLNLPSVPGIPKLAAGPEIIYSLLVIFYLSQSSIRHKYTG